MVGSKHAREEPHNGNSISKKKQSSLVTAVLANPMALERGYRWVVAPRIFDFWVM